MGKLLKQLISTPAIDNDLSNQSKRFFTNKMLTTPLALLFLVKLFLKTNFYALIIDLSLRLKFCKIGIL